MGGHSAIKRRHLLVGVCAVAILTAVSLRVREGLGRDSESIAVSPSRGLPVAIPAPRDYVLHPEVAPGEEGRGPRRIVSLAPSVTETLCALGLADRLVGRTQFCRYPPAVEPVPVVGGIMDTNLEKIRALEPDLIVTTTNSDGVNDKLEMLGLPHASLPHETLEDVFTAIERAGTLCERPATARRLIAHIRRDLERLRTAAHELRQDSPRVLLTLGELPVPPGPVWVPGPTSFLDELLRAAACRNAAAEVMKVPYGEIPLERLVVLDPDAIVTFPASPPSQASTNQLYQSWARVGGMRSIGQRRVRAFGGPEWLSAGPRIALELHRLITVLSDL